MGMTDWVLRLLPLWTMEPGDLGLDESLMSDSFYHTLREARIAELKEELDRVLSQAPERSVDWTALGVCFLTS